MSGDAPSVIATQDRREGSLGALKRARLTARGASQVRMPEKTLNFSRGAGFAGGLQARGIQGTMLDAPYIDPHARTPTSARGANEVTPPEFIAKWQKVKLSERSACQQHFLDLCELLDQPKPAAADPEGAFYTFEKGVKKTGGGDGWADVWMKGHFGWEYKGKHKNLEEAYQQLLLYREDLENPPLTGRLRHGPIRGPYEFHWHAQAYPRLRPGRAGDSRQPRHSPPRLHRPECAEPGHHPRGDYRRCGETVREAG